MQDAANIADSKPQILLIDLENIRNICRINLAILLIFKKDKSRLYIDEIEESFKKFHFPNLFFHLKNFNFEI